MTYCATSVNVQNLGHSTTTGTRQDTRPGSRVSKYSIVAALIILLVSSQIQRKTSFVGRFLIQFIDNAVKADFFGPPCSPISVITVGYKVYEDVSCSIWF